MRSRLLWAFLFVLTFWWIVLGFWWFTAPPDVALGRLSRTATLLPWAHHLPPLAPTVFDFWRIQRETASLWTGPLTLIWIALALLSAAGVWGIAFRINRARIARVAPSEAYRGVGITIGVLPAPKAPERLSVALEPANGEHKSLLDKLAPAERALLEELLAVLAAHGEGHASEALARIERALTLPAAGLACITEAACQLTDDARTRGRILTSLSTWWELPESERYAVLLAVKYRGLALDEVPEMTGRREASKLARELLHNLDGATTSELAWKRKGPFFLIEGGSAGGAGNTAPASAGDEGSGHVDGCSTTVTEQPPRAAPQQPSDGSPRAPAPSHTAPPPRKPTGLLDIFCRELPKLPLRIAGVAESKSVLPMGWKKKGRLYLIEKALAETLWHKLPDGLKEQFQEAPAGARSPLTRALLDVLNLEGWLVTKNGLDELAPKDALWVVRAGKIDFKGVIVLAKLPDHLMDQLPTEDSPFEMKILRPLFFESKNPEREHTPGETLDRKELGANISAEIAAAGSTSRVNLDDLLGGLLRRPAPDSGKKQEGT